MTIPRLLVAIGSAFGMSGASTAVLSSSALWLTLIAFFVASLCFFHFILAVRTTITRRFVRGTDYVYFSLAAAGLFLAFLTQDRAPNQYYLAVATLKQPRDTNELTEGIRALEKFCQPRFQQEFGLLNPIMSTVSWLAFPRPNDDACRFLAIAETILQNNNHAAIPTLINAYEARHPRTELALSSPRQNLSNMIFWIVRFELESQYYKHVVTAQQQPIVKATPEPAIVLTDYFLKTLWPFVLAIAIAIRMTRVTADVTEWPV